MKPIYFLKIHEIDGESKCTDFQGWIEILSFSHSVANGAPAGRHSLSKSAREPDVEYFEVVKLVDTVTPVLNRWCLIGKAIKQVVLASCCQRESLFEFFRCELHDVVVSRASISAHASASNTDAEWNDYPVETVSFAFRKIVWKSKDKGKEDAPFIEASWDADREG